MRLALPTLLLAACAAVTSAQPHSYGTSSPDTLRYLERTTEVHTRSWPDGERVVTMTHDAETTLTFSDSGTAEASFDDLYIRLTTEPEGWLSEPLTRDAIGIPFVLDFGPRGRVRVTETPAFPQVLIDVSDLRWWFEDVFPPLPRGPLSVGETWEDTLRVERGHKRTVTRTGRYTVTRDTTVSGVPAYVVEFVAERSRRSLDTRQVFSGGNAGSSLHGEERGTAYVAADRPVLLFLSVSGTMRGEWTSGTGARKRTVPEEIEYTRSLVLSGGLSP